MSDLNHSIESLFQVGQVPVVIKVCLWQRYVSDKIFKHGLLLINGFNFSSVVILIIFVNLWSENITFVKMTFLFMDHTVPQEWQFWQLLVTLICLEASGSVLLEHLCRLMNFLGMILVLQEMVLELEVVGMFGKQKIFKTVLVSWYKYLKNITCVHG